jgi:hypothetical protein
MRSTTLLFALLVAAMAFSSCRRDDEPEPESPIVGTWHLSEIVIENTPIAFREYRGVSLSPSNENFGYILSETIIIRNNNSFTVKRNYLTWMVLTFEGNYEFVNNELTLNYVGDNDFSETYTLTEDGTLELDIDTQLYFAAVENPQQFPNDYHVFEAATNWIYRKF